MRPHLPAICGAAALVLAGAASAAPVDDLLAECAAAGAGPFFAERGRTAWTAEHHPEEGAARRCADCHGSDLTRAGEHLRTGKRIEPLAPSANPERLSDERKIRKWLYRNCKWTLGRECTPQEKGDFLTFIRAR
ncbi:MAG: DUF1924 domain-containing protein [Chromatiales bacterium]|jgi:hypothetical protein